VAALVIEGAGEAGRALRRIGGAYMLKEEELAVLRDIAQSIAFADDMKGEVDRLIKEGYVSKDGDLYELTPKAEKALQIAVRVSMRDNTQNEDGPDIDCNAASFIACIS
jgi:pyridoxal biosynthesis lyase PdxS